MASWLVLLALIGAAVGSFLTLAVDRWEVATTILTGRSHCDGCKKQLRWWELLPFVGYFLVGGRCPRCHAPIRWLYPVFEALAAFTFVLVGLAHPTLNHIWYGIAELGFVTLLLFLLFHDWLTLTFPAEMLYLTFGISLILAIGRLLWGIEVGRVMVFDTLLHWLSSPASSLGLSVMGLIVGVGALGLIAFPSRGQWMGYGDVWLAAIIGVWVGYPPIIVALLLAFYVGAIVAAGQLVARRVAPNHRLAFGPFLIAGGIIARVYGDVILKWLLRLWGAAV